jgi:hypothetical protein
MALVRITDQYRLALAVRGAAPITWGWILGAFGFSIIFVRHRQPDPTREEA